MLDVEFGAGELEGMSEEWLLAGQHLFDVLGCPAIACRLGEVRAVVAEHGVDSVGNGCGERSEEVGCNTGRDLLVQLDQAELRCSVDGNKEMELALLVWTSAMSMWSIRYNQYVSASRRCLLNLRRATATLVVLEAA